jgi:hypothetical protein
MRLALLSLLLLTVNSLAQIPDGYWAEDQSQAILDSIDNHLLQDRPC